MLSAETAYQIDATQSQRKIQALTDFISNDCLLYTVQRLTGLVSRFVLGGDHNKKSFNIVLCINAKY